MKYFIKLYLKSFFTGFLILFCSNSLFANNSSEKISTFSNKIPLHLAQELSDNGLWTLADDEANTERSKTLIAFVDDLKKLTNQSIETLSSNIISTNNEYDRKLYLVKISILRYFLANEDVAKNNKINLTNLKSLENKWIKKYVEASSALIRSSNIPEYNEIVSNFIDFYKNEKLVVEDLSPENRNKYDRKLGKSHGISLMDKDTHTNKYKVQGFYSSIKDPNSDKIGIFAIDLSNSITDNIVTFAHEIVHAADPKIAAYRNEYRHYLPKVLSLIQKIIPSSYTGSPKDFADSLLPMVFFELGNSEIVMAIINQLGISINNLEEKLSESNVEITDQEKQYLKNWIRSLIGLSIENEYRAYGFSLLIYYYFNQKARFLDESKNLNQFLNLIKKGDDIFAQSLASQMNPFSTYKQRWTTFSNQFLPNTEDKNKAANMILLFEQTYLLELQKFIVELKGRFQAQVSQFIRSNNDINMTVSEDHKREIENQVNNNRYNNWSNPETLNMSFCNNDSRSSSYAQCLNTVDTNTRNLESQASRFSLIAARVSTLWVIRVKENISMLIKDLINLKKSLVILKAGILDFQNLNASELGILGLIDSETQIPNYNSSCSSSYQLRGWIDYDKYTNYFPLDQNFNSDEIPSSVLIERLLKIRLFQALSWIDQSLPLVESHTIGAKAFIEKLNLGLYDKEDLDNNRAIELKNTLINELKTIGFINDELDEAKFLIDFLGNASKLSNEHQWQQASGYFEKRLPNIYSWLFHLGYNIQNNVNEKVVSWDKDIENIYSNLKNVKKECSKTNALLSLGINGPYELAGDQISFFAVCAKKATYLVRESCGVSSNLFLRTNSYGNPILRLFNLSKPFELALPLN